MFDSNFLKQYCAVKLTFLTNTNLQFHEAYFNWLFCGKLEKNREINANTKKFAGNVWFIVENWSRRIKWMTCRVFGIHVTFWPRFNKTNQNIQKYAVQTLAPVEGLPKNNMKNDRFWSIFFKEKSQSPYIFLTGARVFDRCVYIGSNSF